MTVSIKKKIESNALNYKGWSTDRKLIVFESDDWGSIRMANAAAFQAIKNLGIPVDKSPYCLYDCLESEDDVEALFNLLLKYKDANGHNPVITANIVVGNPDFKKIEESGFSKYFYETFTETYKEYTGSQNVLNLLHNGTKENIIVPQFHGREHVNVALWLLLLQQKDPVFLKAFEYKMWGISNDVYTKCSKSIQATFDIDSPAELPFLHDSFTEGAKLFQSVFGFKAKSFIPNNFVWPQKLNNVLLDNEIEYIQGMKYQLLPKTISEKNRKKLRRYNGLEEKTGLINTVRNAQFEPSLWANSKKADAVNRTLWEIKNAFFWKKPAVISIHRINFAGGLSRNNRESNLKLFDNLLSQILKRWPGVEFLSSVKLGESIKYPLPYQ